MLLPLVLGIMAGSIISGQLIARTGRYQIFPIIGSRADGRRAAAVLPDRRRHPALADRCSIMVADRPRPRRQHAADHPGRAERRVTRARSASPTSSVTFFRLDGRHARRRGLPVDPVQRRCPSKISAAFTAAAADARVPGRRCAAHPDQVQAILQPASRAAPALNDTSFLNRLADVARPPVQGRLLRLDERRLPGRRGDHGDRPGRRLLPPRDPAGRPVWQRGPARPRRGGGRSGARGSNSGDGRDRRRAPGPGPSHRPRPDRSRPTRPPNPARSRPSAGT